MYNISEADIASRVAAWEEARLLTAYAIDIREEIANNPVLMASLNVRYWNPFVKMIRKALVKSGNNIYKKLVEPHLDEIYDEEIKDEMEKWCKENDIKECHERSVPKDVLVDVVSDVDKELKNELSKRYFISAFKKVVKTLNPFNIIKSAYAAIKKHGLKVGIKIAVIILIGDLILPGLGALIHPSLFGVLSLTPHTEIAIAAVAVSEGMDKQQLLEWVREYEEHTGKDLVKNKPFI